MAGSDPDSTRGRVLGSLTISLTVSQESLRNLAEAFRKVATIMGQVGRQLEREHQDLYRQEWWKRGEGPPEFIADINESEWWQEGEEPPSGCAA